MWTKSGIESEGQYAFSCELLRFIRFTYESQASDNHPWRKSIESILQHFIFDQKSVTSPKETEILFGLLRGCDFNGLAPYMHAVTQHNDKVQIMGFVNRNWNLKNGAWDQIVEAHKVFDDYSNREYKVLGVVQTAGNSTENKKEKTQSEFHLYDPNELKVVNEAPSSKTQQFKITADVLNSILKECDLLTSIEEDGSSTDTKDIFKLNQRTILMKLINHQLQTNSEQFLQELKKSDFYQALLKFVCKESSIEMKGDIMLLDWLEYKCFAIRKYACENQQSLARQRDVNASLIKTKIYVNYEVNGEKNMTGVKLKSAVNFKNFEERKEIKLVHSNDVFVTGDNKSTEKQIVLIDPDTLMSRASGLDILNQCEAAITYNTDLNQLVKKIFAKQREDRDKYIELAQKTVFLVSHSDYGILNDILQSKQTFKSATKQSQVSQNNEDDDTFEKIFSREIVNYGNFHPAIARKLLQSEGLTIEKRTEKLAQLQKQHRDGLLDLEEDFQSDMIPSSQSNPSQVGFGSLNGIKNFDQSILQAKPAEERSETLSYLKTSFAQYLEKQHDDRVSGSSSHDALYECINTFNRNDLPGEYEKSLIRLFNMYCRHVFWSLIQKDDIQKIFSMILDTSADMRSFAVFMKVLGNECFITGNKVYIKSYKVFMRKVVTACSGQDNKNREFLRILIQEGLIQAYQNNLLNEVRNDPQPYSQRRIEDFFKTESKASQLMNPFIIQPLLRQVLESDPEVLEPFVDRLISILISINCLFVGNYSLKDSIWELIVTILEHVRARAQAIPTQITKSLLNLKVIAHIFKDFEDQSFYEREEAEFARRLLKDNSGNKIDGISRKDTEKLVYARRATCLQYYLRYQNKEKHTKALIEMMYKMYQIDKEVKQQSQFKFKNNLMTHIDLYSKIIDQGQEGELNQYLLFQNHKLEDQNLKIITTEVETNHKEYAGSYTAHFSYPGAEKILAKFNDSSNLQPGAAVLISKDEDGENLLSLTLESSLRKDLAFQNIYSDNFYLHYPVYPSANFTLNITEDSPQLNLLEQPLYRPIIRFEEHNCGKIFLTQDNKIFIWKNEELRRYKDHLDVQQVTFGKHCRIFLLKNGKVWGEGRNKSRHFMDSQQEVPDCKGIEVPFYEKKEKIVQIATFFQVTLAVTESGRVFAVGDKLAKHLKIDTAGKFGFFEIPILNERKPPVEEEEKTKKVEEEKKVVEEEKKAEEVVEEVKQEEVKEPPIVVEVPPPDAPAVPEEVAPEVNVDQVANPLPNENIQVEEVNEQAEPIAQPLPIEPEPELHIEEIIVQPDAPEEFVPAVQEQQEQIPHEEVKVNEQIADEEVKAIDQEPLHIDEKPIVEELEEQINTSSKPADEDETMHALKVWACRSVTPTELVYLVMVVGTKTGRTELRSLGQSQFGNLGQGLDIKTSHTFKPVDFGGHELRSNDDVYIGLDNTFAVTKNGALFGWGSYSPDDKPVFKPTQVKYFDKYNIIKIAGGSRTYALVSPKNHPEKQLIVFGKLTPFANEDSVKVFDVLNGLNVFSIQAVSDRLLISTQGTYQYKKPLSIQNFQEKHQQKCELCDMQTSGLLHFFKDKEDKYHYFCIGCVKSGEMCNRYQPDIMWVIKRPIKHLESKPWPVYNSEQLLQSEFRNTVIYLTKLKINGKEISQQHNLDDLLDSSPKDVNPQIYIRLAKPLKEDSVIEPLSLDSFYTQLSSNGFSLRISPDYGFNEHATKLVEKNQQLYDDFKKALNEIEEVKEPSLKKEFKTKIEDYVAKKIKDTSIQDVLLKDCKISEDTLKFSSETLSELSEDCKRLHIGKYLQYLQYLWGAYSYIHRNADTNPNDFSLLRVYNQNKGKIPLIIKNKILKKLTENLGSDSGGKSVHVNRKKARDFFATGKIDENGEHSVFAQVFRELQSMNYQGMKINTADKKAWFVKFIGEFSMDHGGLFRESLTDMCHELQSHVLNLLVPTQNNKACQGENRDRWTINPLQQITSQQGKMYEFLGALIGMCVRSGILMNLSLPGFVWKQLTDEELNLNDLEEIDKIAVNFINTLQEVRQAVTEEQFIEGYDLYFTTILSNAQEVELCNEGKTKRVDYTNLDEYIKKIIHVRLNECKEQIQHIKKGIDISFDSKFLRLLSWKDLQYKVVGQEKIDVERLKKMTVYRDCNESHDIVKKFWKILSSISNEDKILYLKFVWGRTRLPLKEEEVTEDHTIQLMEKADVNLLPVGRTCFFRLEVPLYKSEDLFREKLLYAIRNCTVIDADIEHVVANDDEEDSNQGNDEQLRRVNSNSIDGEDNEGDNDNGDQDGQDAQGLFGDDY